MYFLQTFCVVAVAILTIPSRADAVLPPDVLFSIGSQATQIFALLGVAIMSMVSAGSAYLMHGVAFFRTRSGLMLVGSTLCIGALMYGAISVTPRTEYIPPLEQSASNHRGYIALRAVVISKDIENPYVLELDLNSRENADGTFSKYYFAEMIQNNIATNDYTQFTGATDAIEPHDFLEKIERTPFPDLSARETIDYRVTLGEHSISITSNDLHGDFITKNTPEYTKYISVGEAQVNIDDISSSAYIFLSPVHSTDYARYIFTPDYNTVTGTAKQFILFDENGDFYLIDQSSVENPTLAYPSHIWTLHKNRSTGALYKGYSGSITSSAPTVSKESVWHLEAPEYPGFSADITLVKKYARNLHGMLVKGTLTNGTRVHGTAYIQPLN